MAPSHRWPALAGLLALALTGALALLANHVSSSGARPVPASASHAPAGIAGADGADSARAPAWARAGAGGLKPLAVPAKRRETIETSLRPLLAQPGLRAGVFGYDPSSGAFFTIDGGGSYAAASLIKIPLAVALLMAVDRGEIRLEETLEMREEEIATGSGRIQYLPPGTSFSVERLGELMIRKSDNTATNMLIARIGGIEPVNAIFAAWRLDRTRIETPLPDLEGTNRTSPQDLVTVLHRALDEGLLSAPSRQKLLSWMSRSHVRSLIPAGVGRGAFVANKTGDIPGALGDAGYVLASGGRRYLLAVQVERPRNSARAKQLIRAVSSLVWKQMTGEASPLELDRRASRAPRPLRYRPSAS